MDEIKIVCRALIINNENKLLLVKGAKDKFWRLPGGKLEASDKNIKDCIKREIKEELGLEIKVKDVRFVKELEKNTKHYVEFIFEVDLINDDDIKNLVKQNINKISNGELTHIGLFGLEKLQDIDVKPEILKEFGFQTERTIYIS
jgi:8-oxo-dGTP diphosphatase